MYHYCKLCGECMLLICHERTGEWTSADRKSHFKCCLCPEYFLIYSDRYNRVIEEKLCVKDLKAVFHNRTAFNYLHVYKMLPSYKGEIFLKVFRISDLTINELTHELAVQWVKRLSNFPFVFM